VLQEEDEVLTSIDNPDVVILGSGAAGLAAALAAHEMGLRPLVLEKASTLGGRTVDSYGLVWVGQNHLGQAAGFSDTQHEVLAYLRFLGGGNVDDDRLAAFVDCSPEAVRFFEKCGVPFRIVRGLPDHYYRNAPGAHAAGRTIEADLISGFDLGDWRGRVATPDVPAFVTAEEQIAWGGINSFSGWEPGLVHERRRQDMRGKGLGLICHFLKLLRARGIAVLSDQQIDRLAVDGTRVTGVVLRSGETIGARKGVVLATGGYGANPQMVREFEQLPGFIHEASGVMPASLTGDGLVLAAEVGGIVHKIENNLLVMLAYIVPSEVPGGKPTCVHAGIVELCSPHTIVVNRSGKRFADETFFQGMVPQLRLFDATRHEYPNLPAYLIFDAQYLSKFSFANRPAGSAVPDTVTRAENLSELASKLGMDGEALLETVFRFNGFANTGTDEDFHRGEHQWRLAATVSRGGNPSLGTIEQPPFYGIELRPASGASVGLLTDRHGRVTHHRRRPIPGLYASGTVAAATEQGIGYQAGLSLASAITFSYLAVRHMIDGE
jgi:3-oxosteroid 1-dehydrogenase